jgi:cyclohexadieny/prephenate dehydrogenase
MKITVVGLGLIGASIAKALAGKATITGIDSNPSTVEQALRQGVISRGGSELSLAQGSGLAVIAVPVGSIMDVARGLIPHLDGCAVITDTGSTKEAIVREVDAFWPCFVGSHPIAGKEDPGFGASQADLFSGRVTIITPGRATDSSSLEKARWLWEACGSRVVQMDPQTHDVLMAKVSHMPHLLSFASMAFAHDLHIHKDLLGAGFRDFTRIAASDPVMWRDIFLANREHILKLIDSYIQELEALAKAMSEGRSEALEKMLRTYSSIRRDLYENTR